MPGVPGISERFPHPLPTHNTMSTEKPEALRLAEILERPGYGWASTPAEVAAELRRLAAEVDALRADAERWRLLTRIVEHFPGNLTGAFDAAREG